MSVTLTACRGIQMYLRFEPTSGSEMQQDIYQAYGLGSWNEIQLPPSRKQPLPNPTLVAVPPAQPSQPKVPSAITSSTAGSSRASVAAQQTPAPQVIDDNKGVKASTGSSLLVYRDPNEESSDEEEAPSPAKYPPFSEDTSQDDQDDMDPTGAYVAAKLRLPH